MRTSSSSGFPRASPVASSSTDEAARRALGGIDPADVVDVVNAEMLRALRVVSVEQGHDPRGFALVAFGGAGPLHACALAEELGATRVLVAGGRRCALRRRARCKRRAARPRPLVPLSARRRRRASGGGRGEPSLPRPVVRAVGAARGRTSTSASTGCTRSATGTPTAGASLSSSRCARPMSRPGLALELRAAERRRVSGPELVVLDGATCWVPDGWAGETDAHGTLVLERVR